MNRQTPRGECQMRGEEDEMDEGRERERQKAGWKAVEKRVIGLTE